MEKGDISNEMPKRVLVTTEVFMTEYTIITKRLRFIPVKDINQTIRKDVLSFLYMFTTKRGITLELVSYSMDDEKLQALMLELDEMGTNPFRYANAYSSMDLLVNELPYRPEVIGVLDLEQNLMRYGHWGLDFNSL